MRGARAVRATAAPFLAFALAFVALPRGAEARENAPAQPPEMTPYVARPGDSLYDIATRYLRNPADWKKL
ncbi:peptidase M23, partial [Paraburkholderia sp. BR14261]